MSTNRSFEPWPELPWEAWKETAATLHMWTQIVGKIRMARMPWINHSWHVTLYVSPRGLTTSPIPLGQRSFQIDFDFVDHELVVTTGRAREAIALEPQTTADFYRRLMAALARLDLETEIFARPNEVEPAIPFAEDTEHASYDGAAVERFWQALRQVDRVFTGFRAGFLGKSSPSHFFWGSFDLAVTRFSGRRAPAHPGGYPNMPLEVMQEAYSHECSSAGFWPGGEEMPFPMFYSYAYPTPEGFAAAEVRPAEAGWNDELGEFVLRYEDVRRSPAPEKTLLEFLETTYLAAARAAGWNIEELAQRFSRTRVDGAK